jgi:diphthine synthase
MGELLFIGLGLYDEQDMSLKAIQEAKNCDVLFAEFYTSVHQAADTQKLENLLGKKVEVLKRKEVEEGNKILNVSRTQRIGFLVPGDPMMATTHVELRLRAEKEGIKTKLIHGQSIFSAVAGLLGLQSYKFGKATTIPFRKKGYAPTSPYHVIKQNKELGFHTLILLDIDEEKGRTSTTHEALNYLLEIESSEGGRVLTNDTLVCVIADAGSQSPYVRADYLKNIQIEKIEHKAQTIIIPGDLHFMEIEALIVLANAPKNLKT